MKITVTDINDKRFEIPAPISMSISQEEDVPADTMSAVFACDSTLTELKSVIVTDNDDVLFSGVVDKQLVCMLNNLMMTKITCRSMAGPLLDSEAYPRSYVLPSIEVLYEVCLKQYGIKGVIGKGSAVSTVFQVDKGMSVWQVIEDFCTRFLNIKPKITADGYLDISGTKSDKKLTFDNNTERIYTEISKTINRHNQVSNVIAKLSLDEDYTYNIGNDDAISRGLLNIRYLNCAELPNEYLNIADRIIDNSHKYSVEYTLKCPYKLLNSLGCSAAINDNKLGRADGLVISAAEYRLGKDGEYTEITLRKEI